MEMGCIQKEEMMAKWKRTYLYYDYDKANDVYRGLKREGVKVKMTSRKLDKTESKIHKGARRAYSIYRWRIF